MTKLVKLVDQNSFVYYVRALCELWILRENSDREIINSALVFRLNVKVKDILFVVRIRALEYETLRTV